MDDGVGAVPLQQGVHGGTVAYVGVRRADSDDVVTRGRDHDVPTEVAGAATGDEQPHQKTR